MIQVEEVHYMDSEDYETSSEFQALQQEFDSIVNHIDDLWEEADSEYAAFMSEMWKKYGRDWSSYLNPSESNRERILLRNRDRYNTSIYNTEEIAFREMINRHGDDFEIAFSVDDLRLEVNEPEAAEVFLQLDRPIHSTRLDYTSSGLFGKREIALTVPGIESWKENDEIHFGEADDGRAIAWVRFGEVEMKRRLTEEEVASALRLRPSADKWEKVDGSNFVVKRDVYFAPNTRHRAGHDYIVDRDGHFEVIFGRSISNEGFVLTERQHELLKALINGFDSLEEAVNCYNEFCCRAKTGTDRVLVIDEIQSNRHQEAREHGYRSDKDYDRKSVELIGRLGALDQRRQELQEREVQLLSEISRSPEVQSLLDADGSIKEGKSLEYRVRLDTHPELTALRKELGTIYHDYSETKTLLNALDSEYAAAVPDAPFEKNWQELCMKRMIRYAAENGYDRVAWLNGQQQAERYDLTKEINFVSYDKESKKLLAGTLVDGVIDYNYYTIEETIEPEGLSKYLGKDLAPKILETGVLQDADLRIGGEGMKAFYDRILPSFVNKYGKQWGVQVEDYDIPALQINNTSYGQKLHSVKVTDQMKQDVLQGQPMFFRNGARQAYGFVHNGTIYIDPRIATAETPLHEYTHLWAEVLRQRNPQEWQHIVGMMKDTPEVWNYVKQNYPDLRTDDQIADEALAQFSGSRGYRKLQEFVDGKQNADTIFGKIMEALGRFWSSVAEFFGIHYTNKEEVADRILFDLLNEVNPLDYKFDNVVGLRESQENQVNSESFKLWFGDWEKSRLLERVDLDLLQESFDEIKAELPKKERQAREAYDEFAFDMGSKYGFDWLERLTDEEREEEHNLLDYRDKYDLEENDSNELAFKELQIRFGSHISEVVSHSNGQLYMLYEPEELEVSKVVDEAGRPLVVEHATNADFTQFDFSHIGENSMDNGLFGAGFYFGTHAPGWMSEAKHVLKVYLDIRHPFEVNDDIINDIYSEIRDKMNTPAMRGLTIKGFNNREIQVGDFIDHIFEVDELIKYHPEQVREFMAQDEELQFVHPNDRQRIWRQNEIAARTGIGSIALSWQVFINDQISSYQFTAAAIQDGYDGVIVDRGEGYKEYVAFFPNQIKSATDNIGLFSKETNDIRYHFIGEQGATNLDRFYGSNAVDMLRHAEKLEKTDSSARDIKIATGWERGADGQWRYEIPGFQDFSIRGNLDWLNYHPEVTRYLELLHKENAYFFGVTGAEPLTDEERKELTGLRQLPIVRNYDPKVTYKNPSKLKLKDYMDAPELFAAYPEFRDMPVVLDKLPQSTGGSLVTTEDWLGEERSKYIRINEYTMALARDMYSDSARQQVIDVLVHEVQHAIQDVEGFAQGGTPGQRVTLEGVALQHVQDEIAAIENNEDFKAWREADKEYRLAASKLHAVLQNENRNYPALLELTNQEVQTKHDAYMLYSVEVRNMERRLHELQTQVKDGLVLDFDSYSRLAGEVEANNVIARKSKTLEQRRSSLASDTEAFPRDQQIVTHEKTLMAASMEQPVSPAIFNPGDIIITLPDSSGARKVGRVDKVDDQLLHYTVSNGLIMVGQSQELQFATDWRLATAEEKQAFLDEEKRVLASETGQEQQRLQRLSSDAPRRLTLADREAGGAIVDHLLAMGIPVSTDNRQNHKALKEALKDQSEAGRVRHFKTVQGESYGFAYKGQIHLDLRKVDAELPLHEFAHLWCESLRRINPDNWKRVVETIRQDADTWQYVRGAYPELTDENDLAEEVIAHYSGKRGAAKLRQELETLSLRDSSYRSKWGNIFQNVAKAIRDFWKHVGDSLNIHYESKEDIADQILKDFALQVNPVQKVEKWLASRDKEYAAAVERGDVDKARDLFWDALHEHIGNGITPFMSVDGYRGKLDRLARDVKDETNMEAINKAADFMAPFVRAGMVLVPAPGHEGYATHTLALAHAISDRSFAPVADVLKSDPRQSQYDAKKETGRPLSAEQLGIRMEGELPVWEGENPITCLPVVIDNVVHSGNTAEACVKALGGGVVLSLASAVSQEKHVASLKSLAPVLYDKDGNLIPLSERFEMKNRYLGRVMNFKDLDAMQLSDDDQPVKANNGKQRLDLLSKEVLTSVDNARVGYSRMVTYGKADDGSEVLQRSLFYDGRSIGGVMVNVETDGTAKAAYLLDVRVHPYDLAEDANQGIEGMELDDEYDYGCIRFDDENSMISFYESHQAEIDYRNGRYDSIQAMAESQGRGAAEALSQTLPVQNPYRPVPPLRPWIDINTDSDFLKRPVEEQDGLRYRPGESLEEYRERNQLYAGHPDFAFYFWQKYADRQEDVRAALGDGLTDANCQDVARKVAHLVDSKAEGFEIRSLLSYSSLSDPVSYYNKYTEAWNQRMQEFRSSATLNQVQGLEGYSVGEIKNLVLSHIEDTFSEAFMDDDFTIKEITIIGSRSRGEAHEGSDLDILLEYGGTSMREDTLFNILNALPLEIEGIRVDINPINEYYSMNTADWLARDAMWREEDKNKSLNVNNMANNVSLPQQPEEQAAAVSPLEERIAFCEQVFNKYAHDNARINAFYGRKDVITENPNLWIDGMNRVMTRDEVGRFFALVEKDTTIPVPVRDALLANRGIFEKEYLIPETSRLNPIVENLLSQVRSGEAAVDQHVVDGRYVLTAFDKKHLLGYEAGYKEVVVGEDMKDHVYIRLDYDNRVTSAEVPEPMVSELLDYAKTRLELRANEKELAQIVGRGNQLNLPEPVVINVDEYVAKDVVDSLSVKDDGTIVLQGRRIDEAGASASFELEGREEYDLSDIKKVLLAAKQTQTDNLSVLRDKIQRLVLSLKQDENGSITIPYNFLRLAPNGKTITEVNLSSEGAVTIPAMSSDLSQVNDEYVLRDLYVSVAAAGLSQAIAYKSAFQENENCIKLRFVEPLEWTDEYQKIHQISYVSLSNYDNNLLIHLSEPSGMASAMDGGDNLVRLLDKVKAEQPLVQLQDDNEYVHVQSADDKIDIYRRLHGWTHTEPALIYNNTEIEVFFFDSKKNTVENIDNEAGIDAYEDRDGFFLVRSEDYEEAFRQLAEHDQEQGFADPLSANEMKVLDKHLVNVKNALPATDTSKSLLAHELTGILINQNVHDAKNIRGYFSNLLKDINKEDKKVLRQQWDTIEGLAGGSLREFAWAVAYRMSDDQIRMLYSNQPLDESKPYRIIVGTDDRPGGVEGEYHLQFKPDIMRVTFGEQEVIAKEFGGTMRVTNGEEWADFYDESSAVKFAEKVIALNADRIVASRDNAAEERREQLRTLLGEVLGTHGQSISINPTDIGDGAKAVYLFNNNGTILYDGEKNGEGLVNRILDIDHLSIASAQFLMNSIKSAKPLEKKLLADVDPMDFLKATLDEVFNNQEEVGKFVYFQKPLPFVSEEGVHYTVNSVYCGSKNYEVIDNEGNKIPFDKFGHYEEIEAAVLKAISNPKESHTFTYKIGNSEFDVNITPMLGREGFMAMMSLHDDKAVLDEPTRLHDDLSRLYLDVKDNFDPTVRSKFAEAVALRHFSTIDRGVHLQEDIVSSFRKAGLLDKPVELVKPFDTDRFAVVSDGGYLCSVSLYEDLDSAKNSMSPTLFIEQSDERRADLYSKLQATLAALNKTKEAAPNHAKFDDVILRAHELGLDFHPVGLKGNISIDAFNIDLDDHDEPKTFQYATVKNNDIDLFESLYDVYDHYKGVSLNVLPEDSQQEILDRLSDSFSAVDSPMVVVYDKQDVPCYALSVLFNGDLSGIDNLEDEKNIRDFMDKMSGYISDLEPNSEFFCPFPAFGQATDCQRVFFFKPITPKELLEQQKASVTAQQPPLTEREKTLVGRYAAANMGNMTQIWPDKAIEGYHAFGIKDSRILLFKDADDNKGVSLSSLPYEKQQNIMDAISSLLDRHLVSLKNKNEIPKYFAFGQEVPQKFIDELKADGVTDFSTENLEKLLHFETQDNGVPMMDITYAREPEEHLENSPELVNNITQSKEFTSMEEKKNEAVQEQETQEQQKKKSPFANIDYTKYSMPEGAEVGKKWVDKQTKGNDAGKYGIFAEINGKLHVRTMYANDVSAFFNEKKGQDGAKATIDQLVAKYFGKSTAESMSIGSVGEAEKVRGEQKEAQEMAEAAEEEKKNESQKSEEQEQKKQEEAKKEKKESVPAEVVQAGLLAGALAAAAENNGVWLNKDGKMSPDLTRDKQIISGFNALMMALHSDANGYKTNMYITFNDARTEGLSVRKGETGLPFNWYSWDKYVSRINSNDVIDKAAYNALPEEEKDLYKAMRSKDERKIFNIDQTTMPAAAKNQYKEILETQEKSVLGRGIKDVVEPEEGKSIFDEYKEKNPDTVLILRTGDDRFELHGADAEKAAAILHVKFESKESDTAALVIPEKELDIILPKLVRDGLRVSVQNNLDKPEVLRRYGTADHIYSNISKLVSGIEKVDAASLDISSLKDTGYDAEKKILIFNAGRSSAPGDEISDAIARANAAYRAVVAYTAADDRLNRGPRGKQLPEDAVKYDKLVQEVSAGVLMARQGMPASISKENLPLIPYWERELKEDPKLVERLESDVNNALSVVSSLRSGKVPDYATIRGEKNIETLKPKFYTIASQLATIPDLEKRNVVIVRDTANKTAAVILPSGASLEVNNEVPGMNKNRFVVALKKEGITDVQFYNAGGALGLNQPNEFFADKTVEVARLKQYEVQTVEKLDLQDEIARTSNVEIDKVTMIRDDQDRHVLYVKPSNGEAFAIYPDAKDIRMFFASLKNPEKFDSIRETLGQKYYAFVQKHPEFKADVLMPNINENLDISRISKVSVSRNPDKEKSFIITATIDGERQKPREVTGVQAQRMWLVDDQDMYKVRLAAILFEDKLGISEGQAAAQFRELDEGQGADNAQENPEQEEQQEQKANRRGGFHR